MARHRIDARRGEVFVVEMDGERFDFTDCYTFAEIANMPADIHDSVLKTRDGRFIRLTVVSDDGEHDAYGIRKGWYSAYLIGAEDAKKVRQSWAVLREQPPAPGGPWK